jgi:phytoene dehydrogenase-like protein
MLDAVVVGAGPNGLTAAVTLAAAGKRVLVLEAAESIGGGARTAELTVPGVRHDVCSAVHPLGLGSPAFSGLPLSDHGLEWAHPAVPLAHPLDGGEAAVVSRDLEATCDRLGPDGSAWRSIVGRVAARWESTLSVAMAPPLWGIRHPLAAIRLARSAIPSAHRLARRFGTDAGRALIAGLAGHAAAPLTTLTTGGVARVLGASVHTVGWPFARGGSQAIAAALASHLGSLGGEIRVSSPVTKWGDMPDARVVLFDTSPETVLRIADHRVSRGTRRRYRSFRRGPGVFKVDVAVDGPIPWENADARGAGTLHLGGTWDEIAGAEAQVAVGEHPERPFVIAAQPIVADPGRAPDGTHVLWAYCRVPPGSTVDMTSRILRQVERFAPGFQDRILTVTSRGPADLEADNANLIDGDITGGAVSLRGVLVRPKVLRPYRVSSGVYLCSASTPPGAGVHGMCGLHAAHAALRELDGR